MSARQTIIDMMNSDTTIDYGMTEYTANDIIVALKDAGYVIVPVELSEAMRIAALNTDLPEIGEPPLYEKIWSAILAAAQEQE